MYIFIHICTYVYMYMYLHIYLVSTRRIRKTSLHDTLALSPYRRRRRFPRLPTSRSLKFSPIPRYQHQFATQGCQRGFASNVFLYRHTYIRMHVHVRTLAFRPSPLCRPPTIAPLSSFLFIPSYFAFDLPCLSS